MAKQVAFTQPERAFRPVKSPEIRMNAADALAAVLEAHSFDGLRRMDQETLPKEE